LENIVSTEVKVGQVWKDKDKRRGTVIEIIDVAEGYNPDTDSAQGLIVGTEKTAEYRIERLVKRWELVQEKPLTKIDMEVGVVYPVSSMQVFDAHGFPTGEVWITDELVTEKEPSYEKKMKEEIDALRKIEQTSTPKAPKRKTREQWLEAAVKLIIKQIFTPASVEVPEVRVSVGWPGGRGPKKNVIGQCFAARTTADKVAQIFVTPAIDDAYTTVETLTHEIIHAVAVDEDGVSAGHRGEFIRIAKEIGFTAPWKSTPASEELREKLQAIADKLGVYPHAAINVGDRPTVQKTYYLKVQCPEDDEYFVRMTQTKIDDFGYPKCPCHNKEMVEEEK
jgi:hypothetical protein